MFMDLLESCRVAAVEEIRKEILRVIRELKEQGKLDFETWESIEKKSQSTAEKIFNRVLKFETDLACYGEAVLELE